MLDYQSYIFEISRILSLPLSPTLPLSLSKKYGEAFASFSRTVEIA